MTRTERESTAGKIAQGGSVRITRHSETARLPHARPGNRHLESLKPPAFHPRITLLKPRHFTPPTQPLTPSPPKTVPWRSANLPCTGFPLPKHPKSSRPILQPFTGIHPGIPQIAPLSSKWDRLGTPWVRLPPSQARTREPPICQPFVKLKLTAAMPKNPPAPPLSQAKPPPL